MNTLYKTIFLTFSFIGLISIPSLVANSNEVKIVDIPEPEENNSYVGFRAPLQETPLIKLPVRSIKPNGWLLGTLDRQKNGLNGQLGKISAWLDKKDNQWLSDTGDHGWEEVPYWLRGYSSLAYILDDDEMKEETQVWFDVVLDNVKNDGFLGPRNYENGNPELWAQMIMLWALQTYYEATGDERALTVMTNYFKWEMTVDDSQFLKGLWQEKREGDNIWSILWLYNHTGDETILPLIPKIHRNTSNWRMTDDLPNWHGVNVAQGFREPARYYMFSKSPQMLQYTYDNFETMRNRYGLVPGGMYGADENARVGYFDPRQGAETCAIVEHMASDEILMGITGDIFWADHCEDLAFNTFPAAMTPDLKTLRYITSPNMAISDEKLHGPSINNNLRGMLSMSPFSSRCCQHNHGMGWPYFAEHLVMATSDNGLAAMLYSSSLIKAKVANGKEITIEQTTNYPFDDKIVFTIGPDSEVEFPFYLRIPRWTKDAKIAVNGELFDISNSSGKYAQISGKWKDGDIVELTLPMEITTKTWLQNKGSVNVNYGPLTLSLLIDESLENHDSRDPEFVQDDSHWQEGVDASAWPSYVLKPLSEWNYALPLDNQYLPLEIKVIKKDWSSDSFPFTPENVPLEFTAKGVKIPILGI